MSHKQLPSLGDNSFEGLKQTNAHGAEYWSARDLQPLLGYSQWRRFEQAVERAITSCKKSGNNPNHHFAGAGKPITSGKGAVQVVEDYHLSRFACYLIAQNGDPRKPEIAQAQKYFAVQTRRQELSDQLTADRERLELRTSKPARNSRPCPVQRNWPVSKAGCSACFTTPVTRGCTGGLGRDDIKARKGIPEKENLMDRMNATELAANQFRMTQTRDKLAREGIRDQQQAIRTHEQVGKEVRDAIKRIGGDLPERIPPAEHINAVERRVKGAIPKLELDERDAGGLLGDTGDKTKGE